MSLQKKNVIQEFMQEDYVPTAEQQIVKYVMGKGNNLHEVESYSGSTFLVSMPKKYRQTVWLKRGDCIVIDPIVEGKKVLGEVLCLLPLKTVTKLIESGNWPSVSSAETSPSSSTASTAVDSGGAGDHSETEDLKTILLNFFKHNSSGGGKFEGEHSSPSPTLPLSSSEDESDEEEEDEQQVHQGDGDSVCQSQLVAEELEEPIQKIPEESTGQGVGIEFPEVYEQEPGVDGYKSRVQFLTSGIVTVTNVVNDLNSLLSEPGIQSLDFETEESSTEESSSTATSPLPLFQRQANTIRIQVNYPPEKNKQEEEEEQHTTRHVSRL